MSVGKAVTPSAPAQEDGSKRLPLRLLPYGIAVLCVAIAAGLRSLFTPLLGNDFPFATFVLAVMILAYYGGMGPALLATALGAVAGVYLFLPPHHTLLLHRPLDVMAVGVYGFICIGITGLIESLRKSRASAKANALEAQCQREQMEQQVRMLEEAEGRIRTKREQIEALNARLQVMMRETQDRVRNNLQIITALVDIQMMGEETVPMTAMQRVGQHGQVLAAIHEMISQSAFRLEEERCFSLQELTDRIALFAQNVIRSRRLQLQVGEGHLTVDQATALALLINELISNAVLHGQGKIELRLSIENEEVHLELRDEGSGFPEGFDPARDARIGIQLIENYARWDLQGQIAYENRPEGGASVRVDFPLSPPATMVIPPGAVSSRKGDTLRF
jgi:two-component sensor histidine kinase